MVNENVILVANYDLTPSVPDKWIRQSTYNGSFNLKERRARVNTTL